MKMMTRNETNHKALCNIVEKNGAINNDNELNKTYMTDCMTEESKILRKEKKRMPLLISERNAANDVSNSVNLRQTKQQRSSIWT